MQRWSRCSWAGDDPEYIKYHDTEWGVPVHDDIKLFEFLVLDGFQAGLSWLTILKKRVNFRKAFDNFDPEIVAGYDVHKIDELMGDPGIIRNRMKIVSAVSNAAATLEIRSEFNSFDTYIWRFTDGKTKINRWQAVEEIPASTAESVTMSIDLKNRGFKFVGPTICYAFMQAAGMVNDHTIDCFRHGQV